MTTENTQAWLRAWHEQPLREVLRQESGRWVKAPTAFQWRQDIMPFKRAPSIFAAMRTNYDWYFEQEDQGAVTLVLDGTEVAKHDFVIGLGAELSDTNGYYVVLTRGGVRVLRPLPAETYRGYGYGAITYKEVEGGVQAVANPLGPTGPVVVTFVYSNGSFQLYEGDNPNKPARLLASFNDPRPRPGVHMFTLGMVGDPSSTDEVHIRYMQKWRR